MIHPSPPQDRLRSLEALSVLAASELHDWMRHGVEMWVSEVRADVRVDAFAPVILNPREPGARQLARAVADIIYEFNPLTFRRDLEQVVGEQLATWSYTDGVGIAAFLLEFAGWFGCSGIVRAIRAMMARPIHLGRHARLTLARALGFVVCRRVPPATAVVIVRRMVECNLSPPAVLAQGVAYIAAADPAQLPALLDEFLPDWDLSGLAADANRLLADQLVDRIGLAGIATLLLSDDAERLQAVSALLQAHRLEIVREGRDFLVVDKIGGATFSLPGKTVVTQAERALEDFTVKQFERRGVGDLGITDEALLALADSLQ
jgi:hypothetical protein